MSFEILYHGLIDNVIQFGEKRQSRAGPTRQLFGQTLTIYDVAQGVFPVLTSRKIFYKPVFGELAAFIRGATDLETFKKFGCNYWDENAKAWEYNKSNSPEEYEVGQIYGAQWRDWQGRGHDQLRTLIDGLITQPYSRRHLLTAYDPTEKWQCLPPCHILTQFNVSKLGALDCQVYMRSVDLCVGLPSDIILYAALLILVAQETDLHPGKLIFAFGDTHVYENHVQTWLTEQAGRTLHKLPYYALNKARLFDFEPNQIELIEYNHHEKVSYAFNV